MNTLLAYAPCDWPYDGTDGGMKREDFLYYVGGLWKNLEIAMNRTDLDVAFCHFFCSQVMNAVEEEDCGGMSFTPVLSSASSSSSSGAALAPVQHFTNKVRYKPQGRVPDQRYRNKATHSQRSSGLLSRPVQAARGVLPRPSGGHRAQEW
jgi:hypothetical protein